MATAAAVPPQETAPLSEVQRIVNVFFAPSKTFTDLRRSASWWLPFILSAIISVGFAYVVDQKVGFPKVAENDLRLHPKQADQIERLPADQHEKNTQLRTVIFKVIGYGGWIFGLVFALIISSVLLATFKFAVGADVRFKTSYALVIFAWFPMIFVHLLAILSLLAGVNSDGFMIQTPAATSLGAFVDPAASPALFALLSSFDIITFWCLVLMSIGFSCIGNVKRGTAYAVVFGWFAFWVVVKVGLAAAS